MSLSRTGPRNWFKSYYICKHLQNFQGIVLDNDSKLSLLKYLWKYVCYIHSVRYQSSFNHSKHYVKQDLIQTSQNLQQKA